jgi:signal recognition particle subunit SRP54
MKDLVGMIPGASKAMKDVEIERCQNTLKLLSIPWRRKKQACFDWCQKKARIAKFWNKIEQVNQLMKQFDQMSKMMKMMQGQEEKTSWKWWAEVEPNGMPGMKINKVKKRKS